MLVLRLSFFLSLFLFVISCEKSIEPIGDGAPISINVVADGIGDHNGSASESELEFIHEYFQSNKQAWIIGTNAAGNETYEVKTIPSDILVKSIKGMKLVGPFTSENDLRHKLDDISFRIPFVGVYVLTRLNECLIIRFFRSPGPRVGHVEWEEFQII